MTYVLLLEDDRWLADSYKKILNTASFTVRHVVDAAAAMATVEERAPAVIVADIMLEGHMVFPLLHELRSYEDTREIPVVLCTTLQDQSLTESTLRVYGVKALLDKATLRPEALVDTVKACTV